MHACFQSLRNFIRTADNGTNNLFDEHERMLCLSPASRKTLMNILTEYIRKECHNKPTQAEIVDICQATISLFPSLRASNSQIGGIVRQYLKFTHSFNS